MTAQYPYADRVRASYDSTELQNLVDCHSSAAPPNTKLPTQWLTPGITIAQVANDSSAPSNSPGFYNVASTTSGSFSARIVRGAAGAGLPGLEVGTPPVAVTPGRFLSWTINLGDQDGSQGWVHYARIRFYDGQKVQVSQGTELSITRSGSGYAAITLGEGGVTIPSGAAYARIITRTTTGAGAGLAGAAVTYAARTSIVTSATSSLVAFRVPFAEPTFTTITGDVVNFRIARGGDLDGVADDLDTGTATVTALGSTLDPLVATRLRRGRKLVIEAATSGAGGSPGSWFPIYTGTISTVDASYGEDKAMSSPRVQITAVDDMALLRGTPAPLAYAGATFGVKFASLVAQPGLDKLAVPFGGQVGNPGTAVLGHDDQATLWDQLVLARNSHEAAKVWVDPRNRLVQRVAATDAFSRSFTFSGDAGAAQSYSDLDLSYGTKSVVNSLSVVRNNDSETDGSKTYGPYVNAASVTEWGAVSASVETVDGVPATLAEFYLRRLAGSRPVPRTLTFTPNLSTVVLVDLYNVAQVLLTRAGVNLSMFVIGVSHEITPSTWRISLTLRPTDELSTNVISTPDAGANTGPSDAYTKTLTSPAGPLASRWLGTAFSTTSGAWTVVPLDSQAEADGITYSSTSSGFVAPSAGRYVVAAGVRFASNMLGRRGLGLAKNLATTFLVKSYSGTGPTVDECHTLTKVLKLDAGDTVFLMALQESGGALNVAGSAERSVYLDIARIGD